MTNSTIHVSSIKFYATGVSKLSSLLLRSRPTRRCTTHLVLSTLLQESKGLLAEYPQRSIVQVSGGCNSGAWLGSSWPPRSTWDGPCLQRRSESHSCQSQHMPDHGPHRERYRRLAPGPLDV